MTAYSPALQPQLGKSKTAQSDCGPRALSVAIDAATKGEVVPTVAALRGRMRRLSGKTNTVDWERALDSYDTAKELGGDFTAVPNTRLNGAEKAGTWGDIISALKKGYGVVVAVDYGLLHKLQPGKTGSSTFKGGHALYLRGINQKGDRVRDWDSLNDGRRKGIPDGPVWTLISSIRQAALSYGRWNKAKEGVFAVIVRPATPVKLPPVPVPPVPEPEDETPTLVGVLSDLIDMRNAGYAGLDGVIDDLETLIGPYTGDTDPDAEPEEGA